MSVVYIALPVALLLALAGVIAFIWAVRSGQLDDWGRLRKSFARFVQRLDGFFDDCR